jgi:hypothetical protein
MIDHLLDSYLQSLPTCTESPMRMRSIVLPPRRHHPHHQLSLMPLSLLRRVTEMVTGQQTDYWR